MYVAVLMWFFNYFVVLWVFCSEWIVLVFLYVFCVLIFVLFFFFKQKTAYEMRISDWSSDVCSSDLRCRTCADSWRRTWRCLSEIARSPRSVAGSMRRAGQSTRGPVSAREWAGSCFLRGSRRSRKAMLKTSARRRDDMHCNALGRRSRPGREAAWACLDRQRFSRDSSHAASFLRTSTFLGSTYFGSPSRP